MGRSYNRYKFSIRHSPVRPRDSVAWLGRGKAAYSRARRSAGDMFKRFRRR